LEAMEASRRKELLVATQSIDDEVEIVVADSGPGIAPEITERLFQPFVTTKASGLGLGLSICRDIIAAHGGRLNAAAAPTGGTVFTIRLPRLPVD